MCRSAALVAPRIKTSSNIHSSLLVVAVDDGHGRLLFLDAYTLDGDVDRVRWLSECKLMEVMRDVS